MSVRAFSTARPPLHAEEEILAKVVQESPFGIVISTVADGRILDCNEGFLVLSGYTRADVIGQSAVELGMWVAGERAALLATLRGQHHVRNFATQMRTKTGEMRHIVAAVEPLDLDGLACLLTHVSDVTEQRRAEAAREAAEAQYRALIEQIPIITYTQNLDDAATYTFVSPQVEAILGFAPAEMVHHPSFLTGRLHEDDRAAVIAEDARTRESGEPFRLEYRVWARDGRWVWLRDESILVRDEEGQPRHWQGVLLDVTDQRQAEIALTLAERRYRDLFDDAPVMYVSTRDDAGTPAIEDCNTLFLSALGYDRAEVIGRSLADFHVPESRDALLGTLPVSECRLLARNGAVLDVLALARPETDGGGRPRGMRIGFVDVTARKEMEAALRESEERFHSAFDHAPIGLAVVAPSGIRQVNRSLCDLLGFGEADLLGSSLEEITHPEDLADSRDAAQRFWAGEIEKYQLETRFLRQDGHPIWVQLTASAVQNGGPRHAIIQFQDVTDRRHLDMERAVMLATEREYARQLRELAAMRADLSAMVAHELRSPIAALRIMTSMLGTGELSPREETETIVAIHTQIDQLDRLVTDVAAAAAAERDDFSVQLQPVSLAMLLGGVATFARTALGEHPFDMTAAPDIRVWCDPERISQVLRNLLDNAAKHTPAGTPVALRAIATGARVRIEVADGGPGIAADDLGLIFEKFARGRTAVSGQTPGAGLGLYLSRQIVQAHGGELTVASTPREGSVFRFALKVVT